MSTVSSIIITKNNVGTIKRAIESVKDWSEEVIVIDSGSTDGTQKVARSLEAKVFQVKGGSYSDWRNRGLKEARGEWVFYLDSDEEVSKELIDEVLQAVFNNDFSAYAISRVNIILGKKMMHGGWWPDYVKRLFLKKELKKWEGDLHEEPVYQGVLGHLKNPIIHYKHDNLSEMVEKTNKWSETEARLLFDANHPKMSWWRFIRIMLTELWYRLIIRKSFLDGTEGVTYAIYQMWSKFVTYSKLWEMQTEIQRSKFKNQN